MLEVRCGTADRSHENRFFRYFASQLKHHFDDIGKDGILVGMPECKVRDNLQIDALLITDSSLTIIDLKDYDDCEVVLPDEADFERGRWETNRDFYVRGGSSRNPYSQLMRQRSLLKEILDRFCRHKIADFDAGHITAMVCFSGKVDISGSIPGWAKLKFFVADSQSFLERIYDITNVRPVGLLGSEFATRMFDMLFEAQPYECDIRPSVPFSEEPAHDPGSGAEQTSIARPDDGNQILLSEFFASDQDVLILSSFDRLDRIGLALSAQEEALNAGFAEAMILSPTKLAGDNLCEGLSLDGSIYHEIYDFSSRVVDNEGVQHISLGSLRNGYSLRYEDGNLPLAAEDDDLGFRENERTAFIICESQLVSSNAWLDGQVVFGSGRLLDDVLEYLSIDGGNKGRNKVVFVGDDCQLGASSLTASSMHHEAYSQDLSVRESVIQPSERAETDPSLAERLAADIRQGERSLLVLDSGADLHLATDREAERRLIEDVSANWRSHKIVAYTNEQASNLNRYIKRAVLRNGESLQVGDVLLFNRQFVATSCEPLKDDFPTRTVRNGEFATVTFVEGMPLCLEVPTTGDGPEESLTLLRVRFVPEGSSDEYEARIIKEYLEGAKAELSEAQEIAIRARLSELERAARSKNPFGPGNPWFDSMVAQGNYVKEPDSSGGEQYRQKSDRRKLTPQERSYRREILAKLESPGTEYFQVSNAAMARYGWAVTAHKAQSYIWDNVTLSASAPTLGRHSEQYFRFLYTGASRARNSLSIVRWRDITPFEKTTVVADATAEQHGQKRQALFQISSGETPAEAISSRLTGLGIDGLLVEHVASSSYQERFKISRDGKEAVIAFAYNKKREVGSLTRQKGDTEVFLEVRRAIESLAPAQEIATPMLPAYRYLESIMAEGAEVKVTRSTAYRDEIQIACEGHSCRAVSHYNSKGLVTRLEMRSGDREAFESAMAAIAPEGGE